MPDLWGKWNQHYLDIGINPSRICRDGIVNPDRFSREPRRILFVMKEVDDWEGGDLRPFLAGGPRYQMWHAAARWATGVLQSFPPYESIDRECMNDALNRIASINLKKTSGGASADMSVVNAYALRDRALLIEQIDEIAPDIVIACGVFDILTWLLDLRIDPDRPSGGPVLDPGRHCWVMPLRHPALSGRSSYEKLRDFMAQVETESVGN